MHPSLYRTSNSPNSPLRVGLLLDSAILSHWAAETIDHILESDFATLDLLVFNAPEQGNGAVRPSSSLARRAVDLLRDTERRRLLLFSRYERWDRRNIDPAKDPHVKVDYSDRLREVDSISVAPISKRFVHRFPPEAVDYIRSKQLDVLIRFGFNILRGDILTSAKYGVWSYHHGDNDYYRGGPAYFWEVYESNPLSGAVLQVLTEELDAGKVLCKGIFATHRSISHARNRVQPYWGASTFIIQKLRELHQHGWEHLEKNSIAPAPYAGKKKIYRRPTNSEIVSWLAPLFVKKSLRRLRPQTNIMHWRLAIRCGTKSILDNMPAPDLSGFRLIESAKGRFYADPFLLEQDGKIWLFFEDLEYATRRGRISCCEVRDGNIGEPVPVLEPAYHLSYPCVFRDGNELYMIPESVSNRTVELYRCSRFPDKWELEAVLFRGRAVDTTVWIENGIYWFFTTLQEGRGLATQLWLFSSPTLTGEWIAHPANPLSTDMRNSRSAGRIFRHNGNLFRPSQDCGTDYGFSFTINEVVTLNPCEYKEEPRVTVKPDWAPGLVATHTYGRAGNIDVIDGCTPLRRA